VQYYLKLMIGSLLLIFNAAEASMQNSPIQIAASCRDNTQCIFDGDDIVVDITVANVSNGPVGIPVEFIKKKGPVSVLQDQETGKKFVLRTGLPKSELMEQFTQIPAGGSFITQKTITAHEISALRGVNADFTAKFTIGAPFKLDDGAKAVFLQVDTALRIIGKETAERRAKQHD
jgi:hypothetical protein